EINEILKLGANIDRDCCPDLIGIRSPVLITIMARVSAILDVNMPDNCYIFHDKDSHNQLTIKDAALKFIKLAKNGN
ncbi:hypothetical protein, partial [Pedobacter sp.]|uniref:hypothetical protein n=1 Tax=Pedobacter sp. TaxID=1411316 RepID=UPI002CCC928D